ncbi:hypothetical protein XF24_00196 [candidate division SR1 bacterium Aalborg_AAW-1]|nr:hypothetical protein XF24_00196 [candidate division SR1 bacterium Aalborg_AAW-1]
MDILIVIVAALLGGILGYLVFYRRFANRELINELRKTNLELKHAFQATDRDRMEYEQQNIILKDEIEGLYVKNDDLTHVVSELSRYYYHMKKISDKMQDLARDLQQPLEDMDMRMKPFLYEDGDERQQQFIHQLDDSDIHKRGDFF